MAGPSRRALSARGFGASLALWDHDDDRPRAEDRAAGLGRDTVPTLRAVADRERSRLWVIRHGAGLCQSP